MPFSSDWCKLQQLPHLASPPPSAIGKQALSPGPRSIHRLLFFIRRRLFPFFRRAARKKKKAKSSGRSAPNERPKGITHRRRRQLKPAPTNQTAAVDLISSLRRRTPKPIHLTVGGSNSTQSGQLPVLDARRTTSRASFQLNQLHGTRRSTTQAQTHTN